MPHHNEDNGHSSNHKQLCYQIIDNGPIICLSLLGGSVLSAYVTVPDIKVN